MANPSAATQPYDISAVPYIPSSPGWLEWGLFCGVCAIGAMIVWLRLRPPQVTRVPPLVGQQVLHAVQNLRTLLEKSSPQATFVKQLLGELSVLARRSIWDLHRVSDAGGGGIVEGNEGENGDNQVRELARIETMTPSEISDLLEAHPEVSSAAMLRALLLVEWYKYCPDSALISELARIRERVHAFEKAAEQYYASVGYRQRAG